MKTLLLSFLVTFFLVNKGFGQNLVLNPSFEEYTQCPDNGGQTDYLLDVTNPTWQSSASPDFFSTCGSLCYDLPSTCYGQVSAHAGNNCTGIATYSANTDAREYIQMQLQTPLESGKEYNVNFFVALADSIQYSAYNFGVYFSNVIVDENTFFNLPYSPQIENTSDNLLNERLVWKEIQGSYTALGGEQYLVLGNFDNNASTSEVFMGGANWGNWAFYLIDDVSVILDSSNNVVEELLSESFQVYFSSNNIDIKVNLELEKNVQLYNALGEIVYKSNFVEKSKSIDISCLSNGIYFIQLKTNNQLLTKKIIIN